MYRLHRTDGGQQSQSDVYGIFILCVLNKKSVHNLLSTTAQQQDGAVLVQLQLHPWLLPMCYHHLMVIHMLFPNFHGNFTQGILSHGWLLD